MKSHSNVLVGRGGAAMHHPDQIALFERVLSPFQQVCRGTLVQSGGMLYNVPYFVDFIKGFADELIEDAPNARSPPKRKKPTVSTPLVFLGKYSIVALVEARVDGRSSHQSKQIRSSDDSIALPKSLDFSAVFRGNCPVLFAENLKTTLLYDDFQIAPTICNPFFRPLFSHDERRICMDTLVLHHIPEVQGDEPRSYNHVAFGRHIAVNYTCCQEVYDE